MKLHLHEKQLAFQILTPCTLNCKLCADYSPLYRKKGEKYFVSYEDFCREAEEIFKIYDFIEDVTITGGEPLMHPQLTKIVLFLLEHFHTQFKICRIFTNGTLLPSPTLIEQIKKIEKNNFQIVIDCYGELSTKTQKIAAILEDSNISFRINNYYGEQPYCGGWIDYGPLDKRRNYSKDVLENIYNQCHCAHWKTLLVFKGTLFPCCQAAFGHDFAYFSLSKDEFVDLFDNSVSIEDKKDIVKKFGTAPITACQYCNGFDTQKSLRYPAAEQIID